MNKEFDAVFFDLDGVLTETRNLHFEALSRALSDLGFSLSLKEHDQLYDGLPTFKKIEILKDKFNLSTSQIDTLNRKKQDYTILLLRGEIKPSAKLNEIFKFLKSKNIKIAVCSNTKRITLDYILHNLQVYHFLDITLSNEDVKEPKPSPEIYIKAMNELGVLPEKTLIFEDSPHGLLAARKSRANVFKIENSQKLTLKLLSSFIN